jgi:predicted GNAT family acetyltransferase
MPEENVSVENHQSAQRYEVRLDGAVAFLAYERTGDQITLVRTEVPDAFEGQGIGGRLARTALEDARSAQLRVVPQCPFVRGYIERHPEYQSLIAPSA